MTKGCSSNGDKRSAQRKRDKDHDRLGNKYDTRAGTWGDYDGAEDDYETLLGSWLTTERCRIELELLNIPGKPGRRFEYPPSLILFLLWNMTDDNKSYRRAPGRYRGVLRNLGLPCPSFKTIQRLRLRYFGSGLGQRVIDRASDTLRGMGVPVPFDPVIFEGSGVFPGYKAPQKVPESMKDLEEQALKDAEAEEMRKAMQVFVSREEARSGLPAIGALDGSGAGTTGTGIYMEHIWRINDRNFIKHHALVNLETQKVISFQVTLESPGDQRMMPPIIEGTVRAGVKLVKLTADQAYDTRDNWQAVQETGISFVPNLKKRFDDDLDILQRHVQRMMEEQIGKEISHRLSGYNLRWLVEAFFSAVKRLFGDKVRQRLFPQMAIALRMKYSLYNIRRELILRRTVKEGGLDICTVAGYGETVQEGL